MVRNASEENIKISSWAELHVGLVHYMKGEFEEAAQAAYRAATKNPSPEAMYQMGHYLSLTKKRNERLRDILRTFERAIREDPVYFLKIDVDHKLFEKDLYAVKHEMKALKESLWQEEKERARNKIAEIKREYSSTNWFFNDITRKMLEKLEGNIRQAEEMFKNRQSYLDFRLIQKML